MIISFVALESVTGTARHRAEGGTPPYPEKMVGHIDIALWFEELSCGHSLFGQSGEFPQCTQLESSMLRGMAGVRDTDPIAGQHVLTRKGVSSLFRLNAFNHDSGSLSRDSPLACSFVRLL